MNLSELKVQLQENPSRELIAELVNEAKISNPILKASVFAMMQSMGDEDVHKFANIALLIVHYIETDDKEGLKKLLKRVGVPPAFLGMVAGYATNLSRVQ